MPDPQALVLKRGERRVLACPECGALDTIHALLWNVRGSYKVHMGVTTTRRGERSTDWEQPCVEVNRPETVEIDEEHDEAKDVLLWCSDCQRNLTLPREVTYL